MRLPDNRNNRWTVTALAVALCASVASTSLAASAGSGTTPTPAPAYCGQQSTAGQPFAIRSYPVKAEAGQDYVRSGAHGHGGLLRCITFYVGDKTGAQYIKTLTFGAGGLPIPAAGVDVTYVNCSLPPMRWSPTGKPWNDCSEAWGSSETGWVYPGTDGGSKGAPMIPADTP